MEMPGRRGITFIPDQGVTEQGVHVQVKYMYLIMILDPDHNRSVPRKRSSCFALVFLRIIWNSL